MGGGSAALRAALRGHAARGAARAPRPRRRRHATSGAATSTRWCRRCRARLSSAPTGRPGFDVDFYVGADLAGDPVAGARTSRTAACCSSTDRTRTLPAGVYSWRATTRFTPAESGAHTFTLAQSGQARLLDRRRGRPRRRERHAPGRQPLLRRGQRRPRGRRRARGRPAVDLVIEYSSDGLGLPARGPGRLPPARGRRPHGAGGHRGRRRRRGRGRRRHQRGLGDRGRGPA